MSFTLTQSSLVNSVLWSGNLELGSWLSARIRWRWCRHPLIQVFLKQCNVCALCSFSFSCESRLCGDSNAESFQIFNSLILFALQSHCRPFWRMGPSESLSNLCQYKRLLFPQFANHIFKMASSAVLNPVKEGRFLLPAQLMYTSQTGQLVAMLPWT